MVKTIGLDMNCKQVEIQVEFLQYLPVGKCFKSKYTGNIIQQDCLIKSECIVVVDDSSSLFA